MMAFSCNGYRRAETLLLMSLHVASNIQALFLAPSPSVLVSPYLVPQRVRPTLSGWLGVRERSAFTAQGNWCVTSGGQRFRPTLSGWLGVIEISACTAQGTQCVASGGNFGGSPEPCNGMSYALGPRRTHS